VGVLANIVPGLRDLRTPFTAGILWIALGWLLFRDSLNREALPELYQTIDDLGDAVSAVGSVGALSFCAYLVGIGLEILWSAPLNRLPKVSAKGLNSIQAVVTRKLDPLPDAELAVMAFCHPAISETAEFTTSRSHDGGYGFTSRPSASTSGATGPVAPGVRTRPPLDADAIELEELRAVTRSRDARRLRPKVSQDLNVAVRDELDIVATRLIGAQNELFQLYDRLRAEAEFRLGVMLPLVGVLLVVLPAVLPLLAALAIAVSTGVILTAQALQRRQAAGDRIADALLLQVVEAPALESVTKGIYTEQAFSRGEIRRTGHLMQDDLKRLGVSRFQRAIYGLAGLAQAARRPFAVAAARVLEGCRDLQWLATDAMLHGGRGRRARKNLHAAGLEGRASPTALGDFYRNRDELRRAGAAYGQGASGDAGDRLLDLGMERFYRALLTRGKLVVLPHFVDLMAEQGRLETAERLCRDLVDRGFTNANIPLGDVLRALGRRDEAIEAYVKATASFPAAHARLGQLYLRIGNTEAARHAYEAAAEAGLTVPATELDALGRKPHSSPSG
jgi:tetratricopeptide (TPR) repeat protein